MDVSIVITTYNYENYIEESIESCLNQVTSCNYEVIIVDDGSTDRTSEILHKYSPYCRIIYNKNAGVEVASNIGIRSSKSKYFIRLDADDSLKENLVETLYSFIKSTNFAFAYANYDAIDENSKLIRAIELPKYSPNEIFARGDFLATGTIVNRSYFEEIEGYNEKHKNCGLENYELILKFLHNNYSGGHIEENLFNYRIHSSNMSLNKRLSLIEYGKVMFKKNGYGKFTTNKFHPFGLEL